MQVKPAYTYGNPAQQPLHPIRKCTKSSHIVNNQAEHIERGKYDDKEIKEKDRCVKEKMKRYADNERTVNLPNFYDGVTVLVKQKRFSN